MNNRPNFSRGVVQLFKFLGIISFIGGGIFVLGILTIPIAVGLLASGALLWGFAEVIENLREMNYHLQRNTASQRIPVTDQIEPEGPDATTGSKFSPFTPGSQEEYPQAERNDKPIPPAVTYITVFILVTLFIVFLIKAYIMK
jgi:hypothetical protein